MPKIAFELKVNPKMVRTAMHNDLAVNHLLVCQKRRQVGRTQRKKNEIEYFKNHGSLLEYSDEKMFTVDAVLNNQGVQKFCKHFSSSPDLSSLDYTM